MATVGHDSRSTGGTPGSGARRSPGRIEGLDGLRAIAIVAVLVFHLNPAWLPGGFLGVDVFFVVSGFLITTLLVHEHRRSGRIDFARFWVRRARRLLPALVLTVTVSVLIARTVSADLLVNIGRQIGGALTFSTNWVEILAGSSYFDQTAPQLFMNFWSLAVEEQFYLLWPLTVLLLLSVGSSRVRTLVALGLAAGSTVLMAVLYTPGTDATRVYYGTDTHLMGLMLGAALAFAWANPGLALRIAPTNWGRVGSYAVPLAGAVLLALFVLLDESDPFTFRGGFLLASLATGALVLGLLDRHPTGPTAFQRMTRHPVATWVGVRSYAIYLWHWPVILIIAQDNPSVPGTTSHLLTRLWCVVVTLALSDLTYRFVETPFRRDGFRVVGSRFLSALLRTSRRTRQVVSASLAVLAVVAAVTIATAPDQSETARMLQANEAAAASGAVLTTPTTQGAAGATGAPQPSPIAPTAGTTPAPTTSKSVDGSVANASFTMPTGKEIDAYGDSIMVGSVHALDYYFPGIRMDARSNRRWADGLTAIKARGDGNRRAVVLAFGTNAGVDEERVTDVLDTLGPDRMVVLVNLMGPFARIDRDNATLDRLAAVRPNVIVADWADAVRGHPDQLQSDRIHPSLIGAHLFAKTVRSALAQLSEQHTGTTVTLKDLPIP
ncbi:MAG: acyltransferase family protein [Terracoccus sp.]